MDKERYANIYTAPKSFPLKQRCTVSPAPTNLQGIAAPRHIGAFQICPSACVEMPTVKPGGSGAYL